VAKAAVKAARLQPSSAAAVAATAVAVAVRPLSQAAVGTVAAVVEAAALP
jgi:hypothetical protein